MKLHVCNLSIVVWGVFLWLCGDFQIYTPLPSFILGSSLLLIYMAQVISTMIQRLTTLACKYVKARPKKKGLQKCVLRGTVSVSHFFDAWTFSQCRHLSQ